MRSVEDDQVKPVPGESRARIDLIDAMRGTALMGILLLHAVEHWSLGRYPAATSTWLRVLDAWSLDAADFLFKEKAFAIFATMFGVSFFLIRERWVLSGVDFHRRYLWRLAVLAVLGFFDGVIYCGDFLLTIAIMGVPLLYLDRLGSRTLAWLAVALLVQIPALAETFLLVTTRGFQPSIVQPWVTYRDLLGVFTDGSFLDVCAINAGKGQIARIFWAVDSGRCAQMLGLFLCGLLIGRSRVFADPARLALLARRVLLLGLAGFAALHVIRHFAGEWGLTEPARNHADNLLTSYIGLAHVAVWFGAFVLLFHLGRMRRVLALLVPYGRMSLTCYVMQGVVGVPLFYGYGLALYRYCGPFYSGLIGVALFVVQCVCANFWMKRFNYGPLEWLWRACTFLDFSTPLRRPARPHPLRPAPGWPSP